MASDWLAAVLPANQMPGLKIFVNWHGFLHGNFFITQAQAGHFLRLSQLSTLELNTSRADGAGNRVSSLAKVIAWYLIGNKPLPVPGLILVHRNRLYLNLNQNAYTFP